MESGQRKDKIGNPIPRRISTSNKFTCTFEGEFVVLNVIWIRRFLPILNSSSNAKVRPANLRVLHGSMMMEIGL